MTTDQPAESETRSEAERLAIRAGRRMVSQEQRRQEIVTKAAELFDRHGYALTSMEQIAESVAIAKPTLYHYFKTKQQILQEIHDQFIDVVLERQQGRAGLGLTPSQMLLEFMVDALDLMQTHPGHVRVFFEHRRELSPDGQKATREKRDRYQQITEDIIRTGIEDGSFRNVDARLVTLAISGMCNWAYQWYRPNGPLRTREIAYMFWNLTLYGLASGGPPTTMSS